MSDDIGPRLAEPFDPKAIGWKPQSAKGNRALAVAYIDARDVMDRLDAVVGVGCWQDEYEVLNDGSVVCRLLVKVGDEWVTKTDVGGMSEQPDAGDRLKAAFSDALKRAAVKFGVGRYLYSLPAVWCDYDPQKKQFTQTPQLPAWAMPKRAGQQPTAQQLKPTDDRPTREYMAELLAAKGWEWDQVIANLNAAYQCNYMPTTKMSALPTAHLKAVVAHLEQQPDAAGVAG